MKNLGAISLAVNVILLLLVGNLYRKGSSKAAEVETVTKKDSTGVTVTVPVAAPLKVVYITLDTLYEKYAYFRSEKAKFEKKEKDLSASLEAKGRALESKMAAFQEKVQKGETARAVLESEQQQLVKEQQEFVEERDRRAKGLMEETQKFNEGLLKKLTVQLEQFKAERGYDYVMVYEKGKNLLYANPELDITNDVIAALNKK